MDYDLNSMIINAHFICDSRYENLLPSDLAKSASKIWPLLELLAKVRRTLSYSCPKNFYNLLHVWILIKILSRVCEE